MWAPYHLRVEVTGPARQRPGVEGRMTTQQEVRNLGSTMLISVPQLLLLPCRHPGGSALNRFDCAAAIRQNARTCQLR